MKSNRIIFNSGFNKGYNPLESKPDNLFQTELDKRLRKEYILKLVIRRALEKTI